jgi:hypothetical protein
VVISQKTKHTFNLDPLSDVSDEEKGFMTLRPDLLLELPDGVEYRHIDLKGSVDSVGLGSSTNVSGNFGRR